MEQKMICDDLLDCLWNLIVLLCLLVVPPLLVYLLYLDVLT
jgi:hypothetical protein